MKGIGEHRNFSHRIKPRESRRIKNSLIHNVHDTQLDFLRSIIDTIILSANYEILQSSNIFCDIGKMCRQEFEFEKWTRFTWVTKSLIFLGTTSSRWEKILKSHILLGLDNFTMWTILEYTELFENSSWTTNKKSLRRTNWNRKTNVAISLTLFT